MKKKQESRMRYPWAGLRNVRPTPLRCGEDKLVGEGGVFGVEYPCVRRLRHRRLFTFLFSQGFKATAEAMLDESDAVLSVSRLRSLVLRGEWEDAHRYLSRFLPLERKREASMGVEALALHLFLGQHKLLANIVAGGRETAALLRLQAKKHQERGNKAIHPGRIRLRSILLDFICSQRARDSIDWERVNQVAADLVVDLVFRIPELIDRVVLPGGRMKPHNVLPIFVGSSRRRRCHPTKKQAFRPKAPALVKHYVRMLRSVPASQESYDEQETITKALHWVADIVDDCLKAGKRGIHPLQTSGMKDECFEVGTHRGSHHIHPLQTSGTHGATVPSMSQMFSSLTGPATGMPSVANAGATVPSMSQSMLSSLTGPATGMPSVANAGNLASHVPTTVSPCLGTIRTPVTLTLSGNLTSYGNTGGLMANTGGTADPVSQIMFGSMACPWVPAVACAVTNAGKLATPTRSMSNADAPVSQMMTSNAADSRKNLLPYASLQG